MTDIYQRIKDALHSEHCSYKSTKHFFKYLYTQNENVIQGPGENAGIVALDNRWGLALRIESHNHPSFINPYQGAATGVGGILRDIFTMGARPIGLLDILHFGTSDDNVERFKEAVRGISDYGNTMGIPVVGGGVIQHPSFEHNCLVNVCALGLVDRDKIVYGNVSNTKQILLYIGARTGKDGIGGSEMASKTLTDMDQGAIQTADPYLEKLLMEACCELTELDLVDGMQDMGAAGILCSTSEVVYRGRKKFGENFGVLLNLDAVPLKSDNMDVADILLSESQERMLLVINPTKYSKIIEVIEKWDIQHAVIGFVEDHGQYRVSYKGEVFNWKMGDLFPDLKEEWVSKPTYYDGNTHGSYIRENYYQKFRYDQYDWMVGARTICGPACKWTELDIPEANCTLVVTYACSPNVSTSFSRCLADMYMAEATPLAITNCLNFAHPEDHIGLVEDSIRLLGELGKKHNIPVISGNVSLYNGKGNTAINPTPVIVMVGKKEKLKC